ncbi:MAG: TIGR03619 family F420-dependent LLM class oxidoreductase [Nitrospinota bacterium]|nr:MAG: TIGR03619 family F420-dependent LLM class oxidoreductase [Nitrospinota bacterium]
MKFGWSLPSRGPLARREAVRTLTQKAEELGFDSVWVSDHVVLPTQSRSQYPYDRSGAFPGGAEQDYLEPLILLSYLAGCTERIALGTSVLIIPYRNPIVTAKMLATLDVLSQGRLILGAGVGWWEEEFQALGLDTYAERGACTDEYLQIFRILWTQDDPHFEGKFFRFSQIRFAPKPVQKPHIPIWIGGHSRAAIRRTARLGDAWHPIGLRPPANLLPPEMADKIQELRRLAQEYGRDPQEIAITFRCPLRFTDTADTTQLPFTGTAAKIQEDIRTYQALGVEHIVLDLTGDSLSERLEDMERFASTVRPAFVT